ncbi:MAG: hypothetical protein ACE5KK_04245 [Candidatus Brocadiales bacterium]
MGQREEIINWDKLPLTERLDRADNLARQYGIPNLWYWRDDPKDGHELVMVWVKG